FEVDDERRVRELSSRFLCIGQSNQIPFLILLSIAINTNFNSRSLFISSSNFKQDRRRRLYSQHFLLSISLEEVGSIVAVFGLGTVGLAVAEGAKAIDCQRIIGVGSVLC
ncbi:hypothetical protein IFM89_020791, partial [Coptis chinensis]